MILERKESEIRLYSPPHKLHMIFENIVAISCSADQLVIFLYTRS